MEEKSKLNSIVAKIANENPLHGKKLKENLQLLDDKFFGWAEVFLNKYLRFLEKTGIGLDEAIKFYLNKVNENIYEMVNFFQTGKYRYSSFEEVNARVYANKEVMESYMYGLLLSQVLWKQHYLIFDFYRSNLSNYNTYKNYLEVGGGHGLFINEATELLDHNIEYDLVDVSEKSLEVAESFIDYKGINYIHSDIFEYESNKKYDFISMGEVLEHVENPEALLNKLKSMLNYEGKIFITTPTNAPDIDHIYLFNNTEEIRVLINNCGFNIEQEIEVPTENISPEKAHKRKICVMYAAFLSHK